MTDRAMYARRATVAALMVLGVAGGLPARGERAEGPTYIVRGGAMTASNQNIYVYDADFNPITDAIVTVNGTNIPHQSAAYYGGSLQSSLDPGDTVRLRVEIGLDVVEGVDVVPDPAIVTVPQQDTTLVADGSTLHLEWTCKSDPDDQSISPFPCNSTCSHDLDGTARSFDLPIDNYPLGEAVRIRIYGYNSGTFTGPAAPECDMRLRHIGGPYKFFEVFDPTPAEATTWGGLKSRFE